MTHYFQAHTPNLVAGRKHSITLIQTLHPYCVAAEFPLIVASAAARSAAVLCESAGVCGRAGRPVSPPVV